METKILKGLSIQEKILTEVAVEIRNIEAQFNQKPGIAFIGFEGVPLGKYNIPLHVQMAQNLGFKVFTDIKAADVTEKELFERIDQLNKQPEVNAIVLLQPLPVHLNSVRITGRINPDKEVEGFHAMNMLSTMMPDARKQRYPMLLPTALQLLFENEGIEPEPDQEWVFVLDDEFFSNPFTYMIVRTASIKAVPKDCISTLINRNSRKLASVIGRADFLVIVTKNPEYVQSGWLKPGVCIIDVYANLVKEIQSKKDPDRLIPIIRGGVNVESVTGLAGAVIPIPNGLMSVVIALLFKNTLKAFHFQNVGKEETATAL